MVSSRSLSQHKEYKLFVDTVKREWKTVSDYILAIKIGVPFVEDDTDGNRRMAVRSMLNDPKFKDQLYILENDFPYNLVDGLKHYCLWKIGEVPITETEIHTAIASINSNNYEYEYYINPPHLKSIHDLEHAHIIVDGSKNC